MVDLFSGFGKASCWAHPLRQPGPQTESRIDQRRREHRTAPPVLLRKGRQTGDQHADDDDQQSASETQHRAQRPVDKAQANRAHQARQQPAKQRADEQYDDDDQHEGTDVPYARRVAKRRQPRGEGIGVLECGDQRDDPRRQRNHHAHKPAREGEHGRQTDDPDDDEVECGHGVMIALLQPAALMLASATSAASRDG